MSRVVTPLLALAALAAAGFLGWKYVISQGGTRTSERPPAVAEAPGLPAGVGRRLDDASDLGAPDVYRELFNQHTSTKARRELSSLLETRAAAAASGLEREVDDLLTGLRYRSAIDLVKRYRVAWQGTVVEERSSRMLDELRAEQADQVQGRYEEALRMLEAERYEAALETLRTNWELEARYKAALDDHSIAIERKIRIQQHGDLPAKLLVRQPRKTSILPSAPTSVPPLPGFPHPDVKRRAEAREMLAKARRLFNSRKYQPAAQALSDVVGYYGDLRYVQRRRDGIDALGALARHGVSGVSGLFNASSIQRKGKSIRLRYTFETETEYRDWETMQLFPNDKGGEFAPARSGVRGTGIASYLLRAFFSNDVKIRCEAKLQRSKSCGLVFCQNELETRFLMWMVANHYFVEGENYVKPRPGHSILMFGKGVNNDVPVDSPEMGFIFRGPSITAPALRDGSTAELFFGYRTDTMSGEVGSKGVRKGRSGSTIGDDGRGIERTRPGLFVIENSVIFRDIVIEGKLHPSFEQRRVNDLLDLAATLDDN